VAYDGTGLGTDGAAWGGEIMVADYRQFQRAATYRPIALAGGDAAVRYPWRIALAMVDDAFDGDAPLDALPLFSTIPAADVDVVRQMIRQRLNAPLAHGVGRYFDGMGALGLGRSRAGYEGHLALAWNVAAADGERGRYRYDIARTSPWQLDLRPMVRDAVFELIGGESPARVSARFHNTLAAATADLVRGVARTAGKLPVALSGGCFQNARLTEAVLRELVPEFTVYTHARVPPGDGGLALGQAVVADALAGM
jgi:hydrogenase maturation protein HypF